MPVNGLSACTWKKRMVGNSYNLKSFTEFFHSSFGGEEQQGTQQAYRQDTADTSSLREGLRKVTSLMVTTGL